MEKYNRTKNYPIICTKLKSIKTYLRSFVSQEQLINFGLISIEKEFPSFDVKKEVAKTFSNEITFGTLQLISMTVFYQNLFGTLKLVQITYIQCG